MILFDSACGRHRPRLVEFLDSGRRDESTTAALLHLDRCAVCEREVASTALVLAGLRRLAAEARDARPSEDGWRLLRARLGRPSAPRWPATLRLAGTALSVFLLIAIVAPLNLQDASLSPYEQGAAPALRGSTGSGRVVAVEERLRAWEASSDEFSQAEGEASPANLAARADRLAVRPAVARERRVVRSRAD